MFFLEAEEVLARVKKRGDVFAAVLHKKQKIARDWAEQLANFVPVDPTRKNAKTAPKPSSPVSSVFIRKNAISNSLENRKEVMKRGQTTICMLSKSMQPHGFIMIFASRWEGC